jgi:hypothetical protein
VTDKSKIPQIDGKDFNQCLEDFLGMALKVMRDKFTLFTKVMNHKLGLNSNSRKMPAAREQLVNLTAKTYKKREAEIKNGAKIGKNMIDLLV